MKNKQTITAIIPAKNEENNITRCIKSVKWCDRIIVMWMGNDRTGKIALDLGAEVIEMNKNNANDFIAVQKNINWAIDHATTDWILRIDADEEVPKELKKEILILLNPKSKILSSKQAPNPNSSNSKQSNFDIGNSDLFGTLNLKLGYCPIAYGIPRKQYFWNGFLRGGDWAYDRLIRLFKTGYAEYDPIVSVHEQFKVNGKIGYLQNHLNHYSHPTLEIARKKFQSYTDVEINDLHDPVFTAFIKLLYKPIYVFLRWMIWHHGYRDGIRGLIAGAYRGWYEYLLYSKYLNNYLKKIIK